MTRREIELAALANLEADLARETDPLRLRRLLPMQVALAEDYAAWAREACWRLRKRLYGAERRRDHYLRILALREADLARCTDPLRYRKMPWFPREIDTEWAKLTRAACWRLRRRLYGKEGRSEA